MSQTTNPQPGAAVTFGHLAIETDRQDRPAVGDVTVPCYAIMDEHARVICYVPMTGQINGYRTAVEIVRVLNGGLLVR